MQKFLMKILQKKLKEDYEAQILDLDELLTREQKGKKSVGSNAKKSEREIRDLERSLQRIEKEKLQFEDRYSTLFKDTQRVKEDLTTDTKKANANESKNKLLIRDLDNYKQKLRDLEEVAQKLKEERIRKKSSGLKSKRNKKKQSDEADDEDDDN